MLYLIFTKFHSWYECANCFSVVVSTAGNRSGTDCPICTQIVLPTDSQIYTKKEIDEDSVLHDYILSVKKMNPQWQQEKDFFDSIQFDIMETNNGNTRHRISKTSSART